MTTGDSNPNRRLLHDVRVVDRVLERDLPPADRRLRASIGKALAARLLATLAPAVREARRIRGRAADDRAG